MSDIVSKWDVVEAEILDLLKVIVCISTSKLRVNVA